MSNNRTRKPFSYIGGKGRWLDEIIDCIPEYIAYYVEPFGGSYSIGLALMSENILNRNINYIYNDKNIALLIIFAALSYKECIENICTMFNTTITKELFTLAKSTIDNLDESINYKALPTDKLSELAFYALIKYNYSYNGNGKNYSDKEDLNETLIFTLEDWYEILQDYDFEVHSFNGMLLNKKFDNKNTFMLVDPPYMYDKENRTTEELYRHDMTSIKKHRRFIQSYKYSKASIIIHGYDNWLYDQKLQKTHWHKYILDESAEKRCARRNKDGELPTEIEYIWSNRQLNHLQEVPMHPKRKAVDANGK